MSDGRHKWRTEEALPELQFEIDELLEAEAESRSSLDQNDCRSIETKIESSFDSGSFNRLSEPSQSYEGRHRYDSKFRWKPEEERRLVRKVYLGQS
jgi:hypothetical protein